MKQTRKEKIIRRAVLKFWKLARGMNVHLLPSYAFRLRFGWVVTVDPYAETIQLFVWDRQGRLVMQHTERRPSGRFVNFQTEADHA